MRLVSILVAVALSLPACTVNINNPAPTEEKPAATGTKDRAAPKADDSAAAQRFFDAGWRYCDAVMLSGIWGGDAWEAKVKAGRMLPASGRKSVEDAVGSARAAAAEGRGRACAFHETGYTYDDAAAIAKAWGGSVMDAKGRIETKVMWGDYDVIDQLIAEGKRGGGPQHEADPDAQAMQAFFDSKDVDYCHAKMLSAAWGSTVSQAKVILGHKVMGGHTQLMESALGEARTHARKNPAGRCTWVETGFRYADAELLGQLWDMSVTEAKTALTDKYLYGTEASVRDFLAQNRSGH